MKKFILVLLLVLTFTVSLMGQEKRVEAKTEYVLAPKSIEEIINAGEQLRKFRDNTYRNMMVSLLGEAFIVMGVYDNNRHNNRRGDGAILIGSITILYAAIAQIININKIGKAGEHLKKSMDPFFHYKILKTFEELERR